MYKLVVDIVSIRLLILFSRKSSQSLSIQ